MSETSGGRGLKFCCGGSSWQDNEHNVVCPCLALKKAKLIGQQPLCKSSAWFFLTLLNDSFSVVYIMLR
jgi:hypothetical protein